MNFGPIFKCHFSSFFFFYEFGSFTWEDGHQSWLWEALSSFSFLMNLEATNDHEFLRKKKSLCSCWSHIHQYILYGVQRRKKKLILKGKRERARTLTWDMYAHLNPSREPCFRTRLRGKRRTRSPALPSAPPLYGTLHFLLLLPWRTGISGRSSGRRRTTCRCRPCGTRACRGAPARPHSRPPSVLTSTRSRPRPQRTRSSSTRQGEKLTGPPRHRVQPPPAAAPVPWSSRAVPG